MKRRTIIIIATAGVAAVVLAIGGIVAVTGNKGSAIAGTSVSATPTPTVDTAAVEASRQSAASKAAADAEAARVAKAAADAEAARQAEAARVAAEAKAAAEAAEAAADADLSTYQEPDERAWALVAKDPAAHAGEKYVIYGRVFQFDSVTGTSRFLANTGASQQQYSFQYDTTAMVSATDPAKLADVVEDDIVKMYVKVTGPYSYSTRVGNGNTVTAAQVNTIEVIGHDD